MLVTCCSESLQQKWRMALVVMMLTDTRKDEEIDS